MNSFSVEVLPTFFAIWEIHQSKWISSRYARHPEDLDRATWKPRALSDSLIVATIFFTIEFAWRIDSIRN